MSFEQFIKDDLTIPIDAIFYEINRIIEGDTDFDVSIGTMKHIEKK